MQQKQLEKAYSELKEFAHVVSHDLKEPLRMVALYCELIEQRHAEKMDPEGREFLTTVINSTGRMQNLINNLLAYSTADHLEETTKLVKLNELLVNVLKDLDATVTEYDACVKVDNLPDVKGYDLRLSQLFQNLIANAIKFSKPDTKPVVAISTKDLANGFVEIAVKDNGIGIEAQYHEQIFEPFKRLHSRDEYRGSGLGLSICKKIIEMHGGEIRLESELGRGSTFYFSLPLC